jgi:hypothetical protein
MLKSYEHKTWASLSQLREIIERDGKEKILEFNGYSLKTNKRTFILYNGILTIKK